MGSASIILLVLCACAFSGGGIMFSKLLMKYSKNPVKGETYECGIPAKGTAWVQFPVGYYLFALVFLVFDVELVFLYPWAVVAKKLGMFALIEVGMFLFILFLGLLYAHKKGALRWM